MIKAHGRDFNHHITYLIKLSQTILRYNNGSGHEDY